MAVSPKTFAKRMSVALLTGGFLAFVPMTQAQAHAHSIDLEEKSVVVMNGSLMTDIPVGASFDGVHWRTTVIPAGKMATWPTKPEDGIETLLVRFSGNKDRSSFRKYRLRSGCAYILQWSGPFLSSLDMVKWRCLND